MFTIEENDNYRVSLEHDDSGEKPYDEGAVPILSREFRGYSSRWEAVNDQAEGLTGLLNELQQRFEEDDIERFLKVFVGAYSVRWDSSSNCRYLAFDTPEWREKVGLTDEYLSTATLDREKLAEGSLEEILAWAEGEVYGYVLERRVATHTTYTDPATGETIKEEDAEDWETVESCWGFYGWDYAEEEAKSIFKSYTED